MRQRARVRLFPLLFLLAAMTVTPVHAQGRSLFPVDENVLALWEFAGNVADLSDNGRDGELLGGEFVATPFGRGLRVGALEADSTGLDWSQYASLLQHPYTIEMVIFPEDTSAWRKLFSFDDAADNGWYYRNEGIQSYPNPPLGAGVVPAGEWAYLAFVSTAPDAVDVYFNGELLGNTPAGFVAPPAQAIFFRDDSATGRGEQLQGVVEVLRISDIAREPRAIAGLQQRLRRDAGGDRPIVETIPTPQQVDFSPEVVGTNIGLALLLALGFGLGSTLFNSTIKENEESMRAALHRRLDPVRRRLPARLARPSFPERWTRHWAFTGLLLLLSALIYAFLDPTFTPGPAGLLLYLSILLSLLAVTFLYDIMQGRLARRFYGREGRLEAFPVALLIAIGCVLLSRLLRFQPGYLLGFAAAFVLTTGPSGGDERRARRENALLILAGSAILLLAALAAWALTGLLAGVPLLHSTLALLFVAGLEGVLFVLIPLDFMDGALVFQWSRVAWFAAFVLALYWFCQILLNPASGYLDAFAESNVRLMLFMLALYLLLAGGAWYYFRRAARAPVQPS